MKEKAKYLPPNISFVVTNYSGRDILMTSDLGVEWPWDLSEEDLGGGEI